MRNNIEVITPRIAEHLLSRNAEGNRRVRRGVVRRIADDIRSGRWVLTHQGIAIGTDGRLLDGQHRLHAVIAAGQTVRMVVARDVELEAFRAMDIGAGRTVTDLTGGAVDQRTAAVANSMMVAPGFDVRGGASKGAVIEFYEIHREAIDFAVSVASFTHPTRPNATVVAAVARAFYHVDTDTLRRFCVVLQSGDKDGPHESAATTLRDVLIKERGRHGLASSKAIYSKSANAIHAFARGDALYKLYVRNADLFPLSVSEVTTDA